MITTAEKTRLQAINLAAEAEDRGVSVEQLALVNGVHSARVIALARELHTVLHEMHRELHRIGARQGFSPEQVDVVFGRMLAMMMPGKREVH